MYTVQQLTKCSSRPPSHQLASPQRQARRRLNKALGLDGRSRIVLDEEQGAEYLAAFSRGLVRWVRAVGRSRGGTFCLAVSANHVFWVCRWWPHCSRYRSLGPFALESRAHSGARSVVPARRQLVFLRNRLSALRVRLGWSQDRAVAVAPAARGWRAGELLGMDQVSLGAGCRRYRVASAVLAI